MDIGLQKMTFARDRLVEHHFWCNGIVSDPEYSDFRIMTTKVISLVTIIDDMYDVYGSLDELELFTDFVERFVFMAPSYNTNYLLAYLGFKSCGHQVNFRKTPIYF